MSAAVANPAEGWTAQRVKTLMDTTDLVHGLGHGQIAADLPPALSERLSAPRYRARIERRFIRRTGALAAAPALFESPIPAIVAMGEGGLSEVIVDVGIMCQYAILRRIVDQSVLADLSAMLGVKLVGHDARRATQGASIDLARGIAAPYPEADEAKAVAEAIFRDGLQCWFCWIHSQPALLHKFLYALAPSDAVDGTEPASVSSGSKCRPRECRRRADLFVARLELVLAERDGSTRKDA